MTNPFNTYKHRRSTVTAAYIDPYASASELATIAQWCGGAVHPAADDTHPLPEGEPALLIPTLTGAEEAHAEGYIVRDSQGRYSAYTEAEFHARYTEQEEPEEPEDHYPNARHRSTRAAPTNAQQRARWDVYLRTFLDDAADQEPEPEPRTATGHLRPAESGEPVIGWIDGQPLTLDNTAREPEPENEPEPEPPFIEGMKSATSWLGAKPPKLAYITTPEPEPEPDTPSTPAHPWTGPAWTVGNANDDPADQDADPEPERSTPNTYAHLMQRLQVPEMTEDQADALRAARDKANTARDEAARAWAQEQAEAHARAHADTEINATDLRPGDTITTTRDDGTTYTGTVESINITAHGFTVTVTDPEAHTPDEWTGDDADQRDENEYPATWGDISAWGDRAAEIARSIDTQAADIAEVFGARDLTEVQAIIKTALEDTRRQLRRADIAARAKQWVRDNNTPHHTNDED